MDYTRITKNAGALLKREGLLVKITRGTASVGSGYGVFDDSTKTADAGFLRAQTIVGQRTLILSGLTKAPEVGDVVSGDKDSWTVMEVSTVRPATTTVLYILQVV